jgi:hypothetical protein
MSGDNQKPIFLVVGALAVITGALVLYNCLDYMQRSMLWGFLLVVTGGAGAAAGVFCFKFGMALEEYLPRRQEEVQKWIFVNIGATIGTTLLLLLVGFCGKVDGFDALLSLGLSLYLLKSLN